MSDDQIDLSKSGVSVQNFNPSMYVQNFDELTSLYSVRPQIVDVLQDLKYKVPTPIQMQSWPILIKRKSLIAASPPQSGKMAAYMLGVHHLLKSPTTKGIRAVILVQQRQHAQTVVKMCKEFSKATQLRVDFVKNKDIEKCAFKKLDVLIMSSHNLGVLLNSRRSLKDIIPSLELLVFDCNDSAEFGRSVFAKQLSSLRTTLQTPRLITAVFTAHISPELQKWGEEEMAGHVTVVVSSSAVLRNVISSVKRNLQPPPSTSIPEDDGSELVTSFTSTWMKRALKTSEHTREMAPSTELGAKKRTADAGGGRKFKMAKTGKGFKQFDSQSNSFS